MEPVQLHQMVVVVKPRIQLAVDIYQVLHVLIQQVEQDVFTMVHLVLQLQPLQIAPLLLDYQIWHMLIVKLLMHFVLQIPQVMLV
jgi:hypothetical protein